MNAKTKKSPLISRICIACALMLVLGCAFSACGAAKTRTPEANFDPTTLRAGDSNTDTKGARTYTDYWYAEGDSEHPALYFANNSIMTPVFLNADGTEKTPVATKAKVVDGHLLPDGEGAAEFDFVFNDPFTCYDAASETWFTRGDYDAAHAKIANTKWQSQKNETTLELKGDGTAVFSGAYSSDTGSWQFTAIDHIDIVEEAGNEGFEYTIAYDDSGKATSLDWTFEGNGYTRVD